MLVLSRREGESVVIGARATTLRIEQVSDSGIQLLVCSPDGHTVRPSVTEDSAMSRAEEPRRERTTTVRCEVGGSFLVWSEAIKSDIRVTVVDSSRAYSGRRARIGIRVGAGVEVYREEVLKPPPPQSPAPLVSVTFRDDQFTPSDLALVFTYLSAVAREEGCGGLVAVKGRQLEPSNEEVVS